MPGHTDVAEHLEVVQVVLGEGHPETGATDALEVLDEGFKLLVVHEEALLGPDAVREIVGHGPRKRIGFHPLAAFPVTALGGHFADVDFRVEVRSEGLPVIARVAVDDVEDVDLVEQVLLGIGREHVGHAGIETAAEQGHQSGVLEFLLIGPLPFVFELRHIQRFVVGGVHGSARPLQGRRP